MEKLPDEIVLRVAEHLDNDRRFDVDVAASQKVLAGLARTSRRFCALVSPVLYRHPHLATAKQARRWAWTYTALVNPWSLSTTGPKPALLQPESLLFSFEDLNTRLRYLVQRPPLPSIRPASSTDAFDRLTILSLINCDLAAPLLPDLLGPGRSLRSTLDCLSVEYTDTSGWQATDGVSVNLVLTLAFLLEIFIYVDRRQLSSIDTFVNNQRWQSGEEGGDEMSPSDAEAALFEKALDSASKDYDSFCSVYDDHEWHWPEPTDAFERAFPFLTLTSLTIPSAGRLTFFLIFHTPSFPALKSLAFLPFDEQYLDSDDLSTLRLAALPHGILCPPKVALPWPGLGGPVTPLPPWADDPNWPELSSTELEQYPRKPYKGPTLDLLDMSDVYVQLS
ncbi:hypothetical protein JCM10213_001041 [Rhodosporidiobolus nylandii]